MFMEKGKEKGRKRSVSIIWLPFVLGLLVLLILFVVLTEKDEKDARDIADTTLTFVKSTCQRYDNYKNEKEIKDLVAVLDKAKVLNTYFSTEKQEDETALEDFVLSQRITGVIVTDETLTPVAGSDSQGEDYSELWKRFQEEKNEDSFVNGEQETYTRSVTINGKTYDYAVVLRENDAGVIVAYNDMTEVRSSKNEYSLDSLLTGYTFRMNGTVVITDGEQVLNSNAVNLQGKKVSECPVANTDDSLWESQTMVQLGFNNEIWYGMRKTYRNYYLYAFFPEVEVFSGRSLIMAYSGAVYIVFCFGFLWFRHRSEQTNLRQIAKQFRTIHAISSIYSVNILIQLRAGTWESISMPEFLKESIKNKKQAKEMIPELIEKCVLEADKKEMAEFFNLDTVAERLEGKKLIDIIFEGRDEKWYHSLLIPQRRDENGKIVAVLLVVRDISEEKQKEIDYQEQLKNTAEEAKRANSAKTDFLRRMSHDIRTPINGIRGMVTIGKSCLNEPEKEEECLDKIRTTSDFLLDLVNDVLDMNKLESGEIHLEHKPFNLKEVLEETIGFTEAQAKERGICCKIDKVEGTHWHVIGSPLHLKRILQNVVGNAVKYNKENGSVSLSCLECFSDETTAEFEFICADTGIGMSEEFQKHAFELFAQEHSTARTSYNGTGLGLPITKKLVEQMGGSISFVSRAGEGTTFTIRMKFVIEKEEFEENSEKPIEETSLTGKKILLVEDNELNMEIAEFLLTNEGINVTKAGNGKEAVELFAKSEIGEFDVILMDVMMPVMGGLEATRRIRSMTREDAGQVPIFAMTANAFLDDIARSKAAGMNEHLSKPLDSKKMIETIQRYVRKENRKEEEC